MAPTGSLAFSTNPRLGMTSLGQSGNQGVKPGEPPRLVAAAEYAEYAEVPEYRWV